MAFVRNVLSYRNFPVRCQIKNSRTRNKPGALFKYSIPAAELVAMPLPYSKEIFDGELFGLQ